MFLLPYLFNTYWIIYLLLFTFIFKIIKKYSYTCTSFILYHICYIQHFSLNNSQEFMIHLALQG